MTNTTEFEQRRFGQHVLMLRGARAYTQEALAERSGLSPDTISRLEQGSFAPSLTTLRKLTLGLDLQLSALFSSYELGERELERELRDLLGCRSPSDIGSGLKLLRTYFAELDILRSESACDEGPHAP